MFFLVPFLLFALTFAIGNPGDDTEDTSVVATSVWVTTTVGGKVSVYQTQYSQSFTIGYSTATVSPDAGTVGMGTISGEVGDVRTYSQTTVSNAGVAYYPGAVGVVALVMNLL